MIPVNKKRILPARRLVLLATVTSLAAATLVVGFELRQHNVLAVTAAAAENMNRPVGFADIVEKVKPAVVAVRVKADANAKTTGFDGNSPFPPN
ncbi:MAG: serine peptidase, partial [Pseudolabrys sp.]